MIRYTNVQNTPRDPFIKNMIIPLRPGEVLLEGDQSQAESRIVAWKARDSRLIDLFERNEKVHEYVGGLIFGKKINKKETPEEYDVAKMISHLSNYGGSPQMISQLILDYLEIVVTVSECKTRQNRYYQNFPNIRSVYQGEIQQELQNTFRHLKSCTGFVRKFYQPWGHELLRAAYAHYAQNPVAFITNQALIRLTEAGWGENLYLQGHDAILMTVPEERLLESAKALTIAMTYTLTIGGRDLTIPIELKTGKRWGEMYDYHF